MEKIFENLKKELEMFDKNLTFLQEIVEKRHSDIISNMQSSLEDIKEEYNLELYKLAKNRSLMFSLKDYRSFEICEDYIEEYLVVSNCIKKAFNYFKKEVKSEKVKNEFYYFLNSFQEDNKEVDIIDLSAYDVQKEFSPIFEGLESRLKNLQETYQAIENL